MKPAPVCRTSATKGLPSALCLGVLAAAWIFAAAGCGKSAPAATDAVKQARALLPVGKPQEAVDILGEDSSAEGHFLKSLALYRLNLPDAAREQLQKAVDAAPQDPKYRAFQLRMQLLSNDAAGKGEEILKIYETNHTSAPIALFAATAYLAQRKLDEAQKAFRTSVALSDQAPEFLPEMLIFAINATMPQEAQTILNKIQKIAPDDSLVTMQRIAVMLQIRHFDEALHEAEVYYEAEKQSEPAALLYARALASAPPTAERDKLLRGLIEKFPNQEDLLVLYCAHLARTGRLPDALAFIDQIVAQTPARRKGSLPHMAIKLALDTRDQAAAAAAMEKYKDILQVQPLLQTYYQGRLLHLQHDYAGATAALTSVVQAGKDSPGGARALASEAIVALHQVKVDERLSKKLQDAADEAKKEPAPATPSPPGPAATEPAATGAKKAEG